MPLKPIKFTYKNHHDTIAERTVIPRSLQYITSPGFNYSPGWFLTGFCLDKQAIRSFALSNVVINVHRPSMVTWPFEVEQEES